MRESILSKKEMLEILAYRKRVIEAIITHVPSTIGDGKSRTRLKALYGCIEEYMKVAKEEEELNK